MCSFLQCYAVCDIRADMYSQCLVKSDMCDGVSHCNDGYDEDEENCENERKRRRSYADRFIEHLKHFRRRG